MNPDKGMHDCWVQLKVTCRLDTDLQAKLLLVGLLEFILELKHRLNLPQKFGWGLRLLAAIYFQRETITQRELRTNGCQLHVRLVFICDGRHYKRAARLSIITPVIVVISCC